MEEITVLLIPSLLAVMLIRTAMMPAKLLFKLAVHSGCGLLCLWLLNSIHPFTGIYFPINAATVAIAGFLGLPGIAVMAVLAVTG